MGRTAAGSVAIAVVVAVAMVVGGGAPPDSDRAGSTAAGTMPDVGADTASDGGPAQTDDGVEGVEVHGNWTLEVRDSDGTLVNRRAFHNDLTAGGAQLLATLLTQEGASTTAITVTLGGGSDLCDGFNGPSSLCVETAARTREGDVVQLEASYVVDYDSQITDVSTDVHAEGVPADVYSFTYKALDTPQPVQAGQQVLVTVDISFS